MNAGSAPPPKYRKHFIQLESNAQVFTELIHKLGVSISLKFEDVLPELVAFLPQRTFALILVFPTTRVYKGRLYNKTAE
jgi:ubiquitin carboxyl-terminal hydrolase L3